MIETKFVMAETDWQKIMDYANIAYDEFQSEIGGMLVARLEDDFIVIQNPVILKQTISGASCTLDKKALAAYYAEAIKEYGDDIFFVWWHSHAKMGAGFSGTDDNTIKEWFNSDFVVSLVVNIKGEHKLRVDMFKPVHVYRDDLELTISRPVDDNIIKEVKEKCSKNIVSTKSPFHNFNYNHPFYNNRNYNQQQPIFSLPEERETIYNIYDTIDTLAGDYVDKVINFKKFKKELVKLGKKDVVKACDMELKMLRADEIRNIVNSGCSVSEQVMVYQGASFHL